MKNKLFKKSAYFQVNYLLQISDNCDIAQKMSSLFVDMRKINFGICTQRLSTKNHSHPRHQVVFKWTNPQCWKFDNKHRPEH